jgi:hypothetical protein
VRDPEKVRKYVDSVFKDLSRHLEEGSLADQENFRTLKSEQCIWTGRGFVYPDSAVLMGADNLAPALYIVDPRLAESHKSVLLMLGVSPHAAYQKNLQVQSNIDERVRLKREKACEGKLFWGVSARSTGRKCTS